MSGETQQEKKQPYSGFELLEIIAISADCWAPVRKKPFLPADMSGWVFVGSLALYILALAFGIVNWIQGQRYVWLAYVVLILLLLSGLMSIVGLALISISTYKEIRNQDDIRKKNQQDQAARETEALERLRGYNNPLLKFAAARLRLEHEQMRERFKFLVGSLEKLGMFPAIVPVGVALSKVDVEQDSLDHWVIAAFVVQAVYLLIFLLIGTMQKLEYQGWILQEAIASNSGSEPPEDNGDSCEPPPENPVARTADAASRSLPHRSP